MYPGEWGKEERGMMKRGEDRREERQETGDGGRRREVGYGRRETRDGRQEPRVVVKGSKGYSPTS